MKETIMDLLTSLGSWLKPYNAQVALAIVATLLVIYGDDLNRSFKRHFGKNPFLVRVSLFILLCTFGYGMLSVFITEGLQRLIARVPTHLIPLMVVAAFAALGILADRKKQV